MFDGVVEVVMIRVRDGGVCRSHEACYSLGFWVEVLFLVCCLLVLVLDFDMKLGFSQKRLGYV